MEDLFINMTKKERETHGLFHLEVWFDLELKESLEFTRVFKITAS